MKLYVSGGMTGYPNFNFDKFAEAAALLKSVGYAIEDPGEKGIIDGWSWFDYMRMDLKLVLECDGVATLDDWQCSRGAVAEVSLAHTLHIPVLPVNIWIKSVDTFLLKKSEV